MAELRYHFRSHHGRFVVQECTNICGIVYEDFSSHRDGVRVLLGHCG